VLFGEYKLCYVKYDCKRQDGGDPEMLAKKLIGSIPYIRGFR